MIAQALPAPLAVLFATLWLKGHVKKVDKIDGLEVTISDLRNSVSNLKSDINGRLSRIEAQLERYEVMRDEFMLTKSEMKTQWNRIDEIRRIIYPPRLP